MAEMTGQGYREQAIKDLDGYLDRRDRSTYTLSSATWFYAVAMGKRVLRLEDAIRGIVKWWDSDEDENLMTDLRAIVNEARAALASKEGQL